MAMMMARQVRKRPVSLWNPEKTEARMANHPVEPWDQFVSRGQEKETGELVIKRSLNTWERMRRKQVLNLALGIWDQILHPFAAAVPARNAKRRL